MDFLKVFKTRVLYPDDGLANRDILCFNVTDNS